MDTSGNLYESEYTSDTIRKITPVGTNWVVTTIAGSAGSASYADGTNNAARFYYPWGVAVDTNGSLYVADEYNDLIRKITPVGTNWVVTTIAGSWEISGSTDGTNNGARFYHPSGVAVDGAGNLYVSDYLNDTIRKVTPVGTNWVVTTIGGVAGFTGWADGIGISAKFDEPWGMAADSAGNVYVADTDNNRITKGTPFLALTPLVVLSAPQISNGKTNFSFLLSGPAGSNYVLQVSTNLLNWSSISTSAIPVIGTISLTNAITNYNRRFYRIHLQ